MYKLLAFIMLLGAVSVPAQTYNPKVSLKAFVVPNIKKVYVDVSKAAVGSSATRDMGHSNTTTVAVVGEMDGKKLVELTGAFMKDFASNKPAVVVFLVDDSGKVHKAWGGLAGGKAVELDVPPEQKAPAGQKMDSKSKDIAAVTVCGIKGEGKEYTNKFGTSSVWTNKDFAFFGGVVQTSGKNFKITLTKHSKSGAKAQLKVK